MSPTLTLRYPVASAAADSLLGRTGERVTGHEFHRTRTTPPAGDRPAWTIDGEPTGFTGDTWHASYLHVHWAGHPALPQRFADAVHAGSEVLPAERSMAKEALIIAGRACRDPSDNGFHQAQPAKVGIDHRANAASTADDGPAGSSRDVAAAPPVASGDPDRPSTNPLRHHGDSETGPDLLDLAVNVYPEARPAWLDAALHAAIDTAAAYPDAEPAREALAVRYGLETDRVLPTAGAAEAFTLLAQLPWRNPVVVQPQFTEPQAALERAGHRVDSAFCLAERGFTLEPDAVPDDADLVVVGNPTNPTGVLHPAATIVGLCRPGRLVVVDEAFMDAVPGQPESLVASRLDGLVVVRSLTKQWSIPGVRAGYLAGDPVVVERLRVLQPPWSVSGPAIAATIACSTEKAAAESEARARAMVAWRQPLEAGLAAHGVEFLPSAAPFVLARVGSGVHARLRSLGIAVRRADTFPGLDDSWVRIAVRPREVTERLLAALDEVVAQINPPTAG